MYVRIFVYIYERFFLYIKNRSKTAQDLNGFERFIQKKRSQTAQYLNGSWAVYLEKPLKNRSNLARFLSVFF